MIYCVWYPSGGFGNFVNSIFNSYGQGFARPSRQAVVSDTGNFHNQQLMAPTYFHDPLHYEYDFDNDLNYSVLIDNGINNEGQKFRKHFPSSTVIKLCYSDYSWPVIAHTMIVKAMQSSIPESLPVDSDCWSCDSDWARREKYFLFLRDHPLRHAWRPTADAHCILIEHMLDYDQFRQSLPVQCDDFRSHWLQWQTANHRYFEPVLLAHNILAGQWQSITDIWSQAVLYYTIWCRYGVEVPHNDYPNSFENYQQIAQLLADHGVAIDQP